MSEPIAPIHRWRDRALKAKAENDRLRAALREIKRELGVPDDNYPAPVANAVEIANRALTPDE